MGSRGMFLSPWSLDFNPEDEILAAPVWVRLPFLPLIFWEENYFRAIGNKLGRYIDRAEPKGNSILVQESVWKWIWRRVFQR
jgi:hypothetical protein